tara:strand:- start:66 stop:344 length:279 start_codon:yes stop_codon:yes gene_type:complete
LVSPRNLIMDISSINALASFVSIAGVVFAYLSFLKEKLKSAEDLGQLKQKVVTLEEQSKVNENRFQTIEKKLDNIQVTLTRIDTSVKNLLKD